jgi:hypothetical protein
MFVIIHATRQLVLMQESFDEDALAAVRNSLSRVHETSQRDLLAVKGATEEVKGRFEGLVTRVQELETMTAARFAAIEVGLPAMAEAVRDCAAQTKGLRSDISSVRADYQRGEGDLRTATTALDGDIRSLLAFVNQMNQEVSLRQLLDGCFISECNSPRCRSAMW